MLPSHEFTNYHAGNALAKRLAGEHGVSSSIHAHPARLAVTSKLILELPG